MLVDIAPKVYKAFVSKDKKGTKQLTVWCKNAIDGTMVASHLHYRDEEIQQESYELWIGI
jgi:hypothetical protein